MFCASRLHVILFFTAAAVDIKLGHVKIKDAIFITGFHPRNPRISQDKETLEISTQPENKEQSVFSSDFHYTMGHTLPWADVIHKKLQWRQGLTNKM